MYFAVFKKEICVLNCLFKWNKYWSQIFMYLVTENMAERQLTDVNVKALPITGHWGPEGE